MTESPWVVVLRLPHTDLEYTTDDLSTLSLANLRRFVRQKIGHATLNRRLRFVHQGRILADATDLKQLFPNGQKKSFVLCSIGTIMSRDEFDDDGDTRESFLGGQNQDQIVPNVQPERRGLDRLRDILGDDEVAGLREQFDEIYDATDIERQELEEQWLSEDSTLNNDRMGEVISFAIGAFAGVFMLVLLKIGIFNRRQSVVAGIGAGVNLAFTALRAFS